MLSLSEDLIVRIHRHGWTRDLFRGQFSLEKENVRVDAEGRLALTPHPEAFGRRKDHPYLQTDFSESQIEMITPKFGTVEEAGDFLEALHDVVTLALPDGEYLWPSSNPPILPQDDDRIPIARMEEGFEDEYRQRLAHKYGRKKQLLSGVHYNFSFDEGFLGKLYSASGSHQGFTAFKNSLYAKVARNVLKYRWLLIYLTGASPVFDSSYLECCVRTSDHLDEASRYYPSMNSLRNSLCGYRNEKSLHVSYDSVEAYVRDLRDWVRTGELLHAKEFYSAVRLKSAIKGDPLDNLMEHGVDYMELRLFDLNPLHKVGINRRAMKFVHLFLVFMLLKEDEPFGPEEQRQANRDVDSLMMEGLAAARLGERDGQVRMQEKAWEMAGMMRDTAGRLRLEDRAWLDLLADVEQVVLHPDSSDASVIRSEIAGTSYIEYHLAKAKEYAKKSAEAGYKFTGLEDMELSTQLLLKAAVRRGIRFEIVDREDNFIILTQGDRLEYVKQATKTSLDSYSSVLVMENKAVTKEVLRRHGIRVPDGVELRDRQDALRGFGRFKERKIVVKPKSTNFGLGVTIFTGAFTAEDYEQALAMAFEHDNSVLIEEFVPGKEYRFLVLGSEVTGILHRVPANVTGDGVHTIAQLIERKNDDPLRGRGYRTPLEKIQLGEAEEMFLRSHARSASDIPMAGEVVYLRENSNISTGGDSIDCTDEIPASYKQLAIRAAQAAGAAFCGVDMIINDVNEEASDRNYSIIELNFNPAIHIHCYPYRGKNRRADDRILDLLFGKMG